VLVVKATVPATPFSGVMVQQHCQHRRSSKESRHESHENF
jgi:hypothetical protein